MKVSRDQKDEIRKKLIDAAVDVITEKGFSNATMREISLKAGVGTATIYNYFPAKEKILYGYFLDKHRELVSELEAIQGFDDFSLKEKFQAQMETLFSLYSGDREFVRIAYKMMFDSPLRTFTEFAPVREMFTGTASGFMNAAIEKNEIADHPFRGFIANAYWDYSGLMLLYWLRDDSEHFSNTSNLIDMSLDVIVEVLKSGIVVKMIDIFSFLFRSHIYGNFMKLSEAFSRGGELRKCFMENLGDEDKYAGKQEKSGRKGSGKRGRAE